ASSPTWVAPSATTWRLLRARFFRRTSAIPGTTSRCPSAARLPSPFLPRSPWPSPTMPEPGAPRAALFCALGVGLIWLFLLVAAVALPAANHACARGPACGALLRAGRGVDLALSPRLPRLSAGPDLLRRRHRRSRPAHPRERPEFFRRWLLPARALEIAAP